MSAPEQSLQRMRPFDGPRSYLFVSADSPLGAADAVWGWADGPPDLCVTSPSREARDTAAFASAGHYVTTIHEPMLVGRYPSETADDFAARFAVALRIINAFDTRAAVVVCDELPVAWLAPLIIDGDDLLPCADLIEHKLPPP